MNKIRINIIISGAIILILIATSLSIGYWSYKAYLENIDQRVLEQLLSIKRLKKLHLYDFLDNELKKNEALESSTLTEFFRNDSLVWFTDDRSISSGVKFNHLPTTEGLFDLTEEHENHEFSLIKIVKIRKGELYVRKISTEKINQILSIRTGMGLTGETYLVAKDYRMRTPSRFFKGRKPYDIIVKTIWAKKAFEHTAYQEKILDYRGVEVFSAGNFFEIGNIKWAIFAEIDLDEIYNPLQKLKIRIFFVVIIILLFAILIAVLVSRKITIPIRSLTAQLNEMVMGVYNQPNKQRSDIAEVSEAENYLEQLKLSLQTATQFALHLGKMELETQLDLTYEGDNLRSSLLKMQSQLKSFREKELAHEIEIKKMLIRAEEKERDWISKEIHDNIGPLLTLLKFKIDSCPMEQIIKQELKEKTDKIIQELRFINQKIAPQSVLSFGFYTALSAWLENFSNYAFLKVSCENSTSNLINELSFEVQLTLYRVLQELIHNTVKHAGASKVLIDISAGQSELIISYFDDGKGFKLLDQSKGMGVRNLFERLKLIGGKITQEEIKSGLLLQIEIPINAG